MTRACPVCHTLLREQANFCDHCGYPLPAGAPGPAKAPPSGPQTLAGRIAPGMCSACGYQNILGEMFCQSCGVQLAPVSSIPPPPPAPASQEPGAPAYPTVRCPTCGDRIDPEDAFCQNCGAEAPYDPHPAYRLASGSLDPVTLAEGQRPAAQLVVNGSQAVIKIDLSLEECVVGRTDPQREIYPEVDLGPYGGEQNGVSRRHARLVTQGGRRWISDLNSTNFTFLNGEKLNPGGYYPLTSGDQIRFGLLTLRYEENAE